MLCIYLYCFSLFILLYDHELRIFDDLVGSFPLDIFKIWYPWRQICYIVIELRSVAGKLGIYPLMAWMAFKPGYDLFFFLQVKAHRIVSLSFLIFNLIFIHLLRRIFDLKFRVWWCHIAICVHQINLLVIAIKILSGLLACHPLAFTAFAVFLSWG